MIERVHTIATARERLLGPAVGIYKCGVVGATFQVAEVSAELAGVTAAEIFLSVLREAGVEHQSVDHLEVERECRHA